ncbi:hypothetical protein [Glycomyces rhizosphaerae]|uniref:ABC transporter permease n=1 Tax=Glycomyces rhizosphaerae TaxID=2054422 RepID=A0ABV7Q8Q8_9ACTN
MLNYAHPGLRARRALRGFAATMRISAVIHPADVPYVAVNVVFQLLQFGVLITIWRNLPQDQLGNTAFDVPALLTYTTVATAIGPLLNPQTSLSEHIANGTITVRMLWPMGIASQFASEMLGRILPVMLVTSGVVCGTALLLDVSLVGAGSLGLFAVSLLLGVAVGLMVDFCFALLTVRLANGIWFVITIRMACTTIVSGALIPFSLMPWHIGDVLQFLPFAAMASGPLLVYTQETGALGVIASQAAWALALGLGLMWWSKRLRDKVVGFGG